MTDNEVKNILLQVKINNKSLPVSYDHFDENSNFNVVPPFILFRRTDTTTKKADDHVYWQENNYIVDLVTTKNDPDLQQQLETILNNNFIPYDKEDDYLPDERIYQTRYFI